MFSRQVVGEGIILGLLFIGAIALAAELPVSKTADKPKSSEFRTWTDITGKFKTEAAFVDLKDGKVQLQKKDGIIVSLRIEKLSEADQDWVRGRTKKPGPPGPFKVKISWEKDVSSAIEFSDAPFILYEKSLLFAGKETLMRVRANYQGTQGKVETITFNQFIPVEMPGQKGRIENRLWIFLSKTSFQVFASLEGTGNIKVALFEAVRKPGVAHPEHGTQLSNWISLPVKLPSLKGGFKL